jgi:hypothetical protein
MDVAGRMWFYSIANADLKVCDHLFIEAEKQFEKVISGILKAKHIPSYCHNFKDDLSKCFKSTGIRELDSNISKVMETAYTNCNFISDIALEHYMPPFYSDINKRRFLYQCILESIRIIALFHDIGHPPFSHIMESVLGRLYRECKDDYNNQTNIFNSQKSETLLESLSQFYEDDLYNSEDIVCIVSQSSEIKQALHEQIGLKMLNLALSDTLKDKIAEVCNEKSFDNKTVKAAYYITVAEFCIAIIRNSNPFFCSLHSVVDGIVDADRMDYIERDTINSGVDWGQISYKRLLESCKLTINPKYKDYYCIAFPQKMAEDIEDLLVTRYKIFSRINYNHRAFKTSAILQRLVYLLSIDYLKKKENTNEMCPNISDLWFCLYNTLSVYDLYIIQWNDSTLVSHLYHTLADCKPDECGKYNMNSEDYDEIIHMLEEFLLNKKHYYSVFKRQSDFSPILESVFNALESEIEMVREYETKKLRENSENLNAFDSIRRLDKMLLKSLIKTGDIETFAEIFPLKTTTKEMIEEVLIEFKNSDLINTYLVKFNSQRNNTGLPNQYNELNGIYLYSANNNDPKLYDVSILRKQIVQLQNYCLQYIVYIETENSPDDIIKEIHKNITGKLIDEFRNSMKEIFTCLQENS